MNVYGIDRVYYHVRHTLYSSIIMYVQYKGHLVHWEAMRHVL